MTKAEIITIGTEIMLGQIIDTNTAYISRILAEKGIRVAFQTSVGDEKETIKSALKIAKERATLIITTGGLGPTENDITREAVSELYGVRLISDGEAYKQIQKYRELHHAEIRVGDRRQTLIPEGALVLSNGNGTAAGFVLCQDGICLVCLPGVPGEMRAMFHKYVETFARESSTKEGCIVTRQMHTFGISERLVEDRMQNLKLQDDRVGLMTLVHDGIVTIHIRVTARERDAGLKHLDRVEQELRQEFGQAVFSTDDGSLEHAVAGLLKKRNKTIAVSESCTGGLVSDKLTNISGISAFLVEGVVAYSNKAKVDLLGVPEEFLGKHGAVSPQVAFSMAEGVKKKASANIGVGITGIAGPTGATKEKPVGLVYIAVIVDDRAAIKECRFRGSRVDIKNFSANTALNMVRLKLDASFCSDDLLSC